MAPIHDRMPVILTQDDAAEWLYEGNDADAVRPLLRPAGAAVLVAERFRVGSTLWPTTTRSA